jgi:hypothetical protein
MAHVTVYCGDKLIRAHDGIPAIVNPVCYPLDQILLMYMLARCEGALFHAAGVYMDGRCWIFPGKSGAGKTTLARCLMAHAGPDAEALSDDRMAARKTNGVFYAYGTPWPGDAGVAVNKGAPLGGIFFIRHGAANRIEEINPRQSFERLMPLTSVPWYDRKVMPSVLNFCEDLVSGVPCYDFYFNPSADAARCLESFVKHHH